MDKETLLAAVLPERTVDLDGVGKITVRSLSRAEVLAIRAREIGDAAELERVVLAAAMVDPEMTEDDVRAWQEVSSPEVIEDVASAVLDLSGMRREAVKEQIQRFPDGP